MKKKSITISAAIIWDKIRPLIAGENRREAAQVLFMELELDVVTGALPTAELLFADAGELCNKEYKDACDSCGAEAVWQGTNNEYVGDSHLACNHCVTELNEPVLIE